MNELTDQQLLRDYAEHHSETAFTTLVRRHIDLVHSAAFRLTGEAHSAQDVTQAVFVALAQNADRLAQHPVLSGWLHTTARNLAAKNVRAAVRRQNHEQEAVAMNELLANASETSWETIAPQLDAALGELSEPDRDAVLLRYFEKKSAQEMAGVLGISDEAAQKRVSRAVEKLRELFAKRGVTVGAGGLVVVISANAVQAAPVGLAVTISAAAIATTAVTTSSLIAATKTIAMTTLQKTVITAALVAAVGAGIFEARQAAHLREQNQTLQQSQAPLAEQIMQMKSERDEATNRLASMREEIAKIKSNNNELLKLRGEVTRLRPLQKDVAALQKLINQTESGMPEWKSEQLMNVGRATPQDAVQTYLWSAMNTNLNELRKSFVADENDAAAASEITEFADNPINHPEKGLASIKVLSQQMISSGEVQLEIQVKFAENAGVQNDMGISKVLTLRKVNGEWKLVVFFARDVEGKVSVNLGTKPPPQ